MVALPGRWRVRRGAAAPLALHKAVRLRAGRRWGGGRAAQPHLLWQPAPAGRCATPRRAPPLCGQQAASLGLGRWWHHIACQPLWLRSAGDGKGGVPLNVVDVGGKGFAKGFNVSFGQRTCVRLRKDE